MKKQNTFSLEDVTTNINQLIKQVATASRYGKRAARPRQGFSRR